MALREQKYIRNVTMAMLYGDMIRLVYLPSLRNSGIEVPPDEFISKGTINDQKLEDNIIRAKSRIFELAMCNPWDHFATLTISPDKYDRKNLKKFHADNAQWLRNYNTKHGTNIKYLLIPEQHKDGSWHEHGLFHGIPQSHLTLFTLDQKLPYEIRKKLKEGRALYNWEAYAAKFGYCTIEAVQNHEAVSKYIMKYITKGLTRCVTELGAHLFYASKGLQRGKLLKKGVAVVDFEYTYKGKYASVMWVKATEEMLQKINDGILNRQDIKTEGEQANVVANSNGGIFDRPASERERNFEHGRCVLTMVWR